MLYFKNILLGIAVVLIGGCSSFQSSQTTNQWKNKKVAILPFEIQGMLDKIPEGSNIETLREIERQESHVLQRDLFRYFMREMAKHDYPSDFIQDVNVTNDLLEANEIGIKDLRRVPSDDLAQLLGVDGIISGYISGSNQTSLVSGLFNRTFDADKKVFVKFSLEHISNGKINWLFEDSLVGGNLESPSDISRKMMREAPKTFPF